MIRAQIDAEKLRGFLDCMHDEADEREKHSAQIRAIVKAAKEVGYDTKAIRKVFARERMDEADRAEQDNLLETYEHALGGKGRALAAISNGVPVGEAAKTNGVHRATVARARHVAKQASNATPHDPETGEVNAAPQNSAPLPVPDGGVGTGSSMPSSAPVAASGKEDLGVAAAGGPFNAQPTGETHGNDRQTDTETRIFANGDRLQSTSPRPRLDREGRREISRVSDGPEVGGCDSAEGEGQVVVGVDPRPKGTPIPDDLAIPAFLDQRKRQVHA